MFYSRGKAVFTAALMVAGSLALGASAAQADDEAACVFAGDATVAPWVDFNSNEGAYNFTNVSGACALTDLSDVTETQAAVPVTITSRGEYENWRCGTGTADSELWEGNEDETPWAPDLPPQLGGGNPDEHGQENSTPAVIAGGGPEFPARINYHIDFLAGVGVLSISNWARDDAGHAGIQSDHGDGMGASGQGVVLLGPPRNPALLPPNPGDDSGGELPVVPFGDCVGGFTVAGFAVATLNEPAGV